MLAIVVAVVTAAATMQAAGGMDVLVGVAERALRISPKAITFVGPAVAYVFTFCSGTGHVAYAILPVIAEVSRKAGIRPERPMAISVIASQQAITASPVAAATAALIGLFSEKGLTDWGLREILMICVPSTLLGVLAGALVSMFRGKELADDPEYQRRLAAGEIPPVTPPTERPPLKPGATIVSLFSFGGVNNGPTCILRKAPSAKAAASGVRLVSVFSLTSWIAIGAGRRGTGCVGDALSPGISVAGAGFSSIGNSDLPVTRSNR